MILSKEQIKESISKSQTIRDALLLLEIQKKEVSDRINELNIKTKMYDIGDFSMGQNGYEFFFQSDAYPPNSLTHPPLSNNQKRQYQEQYRDEIKEFSELYSLEDFIGSQIKFYEELSTKYGDKNRSMSIFKKLWDEMVNEHFRTEIFITQLEALEDEEEESYINFCVKNFKRRTIPEWMKHYERLDKADQYEALKKARLEPEIEYANSLRITNVKFEESTLGQYTLGNLKMFESKYVLQNYEKELPVIIKIYRSVVKGYILQRREITTNIKNSENDKVELEKKFDEDIDNIPINFGEELKKLRSDLHELEEIKSKIEYKLWGDYTGKNQGLIWKHDHLVREYKKILTGDDELFEEQEMKSYQRWRIQMKEKIFKVADEIAIKVDEEDIDDIIHEFLKLRIDDEEQFYSEIIEPGIKEENINKAIIQVLNENKTIVKPAVIVESTENNEEGKEAKQREKLKEYLNEHYPDFQTNYQLNVSAIAQEITEKIYPELKGTAKKKKKNSIRTELNQIKSGKL